MEQVRTTSRDELFDLLGVTDEQVAKAEIERDAYMLGWQLATIRKHEGVSQTELAQAMGAQQSRVSKIERGSAPTLATLQAYIAGLGGHLRIQAAFDDHSYEINAESLTTTHPGSPAAA